METQQEFIERRRLAHAQAAVEADTCLLIKLRFGPHDTVVTERERRAYVYPQGFMTRRQAGEPLDVPVSSRDTVLAVTESSRGLGESSSDIRRNRRRRFIRRNYVFARALRWLQQATARLMCPAP